MQIVYVLWHTHTLSEDREGEKIVGIYESEAAAQQAQTRVGTLPGFVTHPEGFEIASYEIGKDHWISGYVTMAGDRELQ